MNMSTGLFVGSFDPFTIGHADIAHRALGLFSKLVIGVGTNDNKHYMFTHDERIRRIQALYADDPRVEVVGYADFAVDLAARVGATHIIKGVRSVQDFEYERTQAAFNKRLGNVETLLLYADPALVEVSSSAVRTLIHFGKDASWMLPEKKDCL